MVEGVGSNPGHAPWVQDRRFLVGALGIVLLLTFSDFFGTGSGSVGEASAQKLSSDTPKFATKFMGPSIKFAYCYSWGYRKVFEQYAGILHEKYPQLVIEGDNYPPDPWKWTLATFFSYTKIALIVCIVASINPFNFTGMETPPVVAWAMENKFYAAMMIFFLSNAVETQLVSTGAFEITVDKMPVWSKIESGRIPQPPELFQIVDTHLKMNTGQDSSALPMDQLWCNLDVDLNYSQDWTKGDTNDFIVSKICFIRLSIEWWMFKFKHMFSHCIVKRINN